jgi:predicted alpha/beta superfamily hydrolase
LYLLDGSSNFYSVTGIIKKLGSTNFNTPLPEMIVVAIPNTNRIQDLVPSHADINLSADDTLYFESGEGDKFLDFIERELNGRLLSIQ